MDTKTLRQKILDLAIRGKLVPQDPSDEPASVLLERIREQKQQMVKEGKLKAKDIKNDSVIFKGEDNLHYEKFQDGTVKCIEEEIPFEVPEGWAWSKIGSLCEYITSGSRGWAKYYSEAGSLFLRMGNLSRDSFDLRLDNLQRVKLPDNTEGIRTRVVENDLLFSITAEIGMLGLIPANFETAYINQHVGLIHFLKEAQTKYFPYILMSEFCRDQYYTVQSGMKNSFRLDNIQNILVPVPPLGEQIRIAEKLNNIWTNIQQIDIESETMSDIITSAKAKILDLAIRGLLVPQDPADEPASVLLERIRAEKEELIKQGKIKRDKKESVIFRGDDNSYYRDIPDNWTVCYLKEIFNICSAKRVRQSEWKASGVPFYRAREIVKLSDNGYVDNDLFISEEHYMKMKTEFGVPKSGDLMVSGVGTIGRVYIVKENDRFYYKDASVLCFENRTGAIDSQFARYMLESKFMQSQMKENSKGTTVDTITISAAMDYVCALPPLAEQKRIVTAIEKAFSQLERISESLA